ncbi:unnamed protein product [Pleuronectes platessa]|uniref:Uncharacterized protein n=1 Tax=Pleuronectes platessa TaxID=8262 RepID=A0A9N7YJP6_PLEPL|nr:unnamed protein product [Pleuronectes platessa]
MRQTGETDRYETEGDETDRDETTGDRQTGDETDRMRDRDDRQDETDRRQVMTTEMRQTVMRQTAAEGPQVSGKGSKSSSKGLTVKSAAGQQPLTGNGLEFPEGIFRLSDESVPLDERQRSD